MNIQENSSKTTYRSCKNCVLSKSLESGDRWCTIHNQPVNPGDICNKYKDNNSYSIVQVVKDLRKFGNKQNKPIDRLLRDVLISFGYPVKVVGRIKSENLVLFIEQVIEDRKYGREATQTKVL